MPDRKQPVFTCELVTETLELSFEDLCRNSGLPGEQIILYVEEGILAPQGTSKTQWRFSRLSLITARRAHRLERDLGLNIAGVALALDLTSRIHELRARLERLEQTPTIAKD